MTTNLNGIKEIFFSFIKKQNSILVVVIISVILTTSVFLVIQSLISRDVNVNKKDKNRNLLEFIRIKENDNLEERTRQIPDKPPQPKRPPQPELVLDDKTPPPVQQFDIDLPEFALPTDFSGAFMGNIEDMGRGTSALIPLVKIAPRCPASAALSGTNGSVTLELLVNDQGKVQSIKVMRARPSKMFNKEATKAVRRWQFKPKSVNGVPVAQRGQLTVEFVCNV